MTKTPSSKTNNGKDKISSQVLKTDINRQANLTDISQSSVLSNNAEGKLTSVKASKSLVFKPAKEQANSHTQNVDKRGELIRVETKSPSKNLSKSIFQRLKAKTAAALVGSAIMLPILAIGTATYYFGSQAVNKQAILAKRSDNIDLAETELARQQELLAALLIGSGITALLAGAIAALGTKRLLDSMSQTSSSGIAEEANTQVYREFIDNLSQSVSQKDTLKAIVEEARNYLNCARTVVYSLDQDRYGEIIAESVALGYTQWLGIAIEDPCFEARYLDKYRDGKVRAIDNIYKTKMTPSHREQLEKLEVKANLVTPIIIEGKLFGLLVAHQCDKPRHWQQGDIEFLHQLAKKTGLALENAKLLDDMVNLQTQAERERKWTNYFTDATKYIRSSIKQEDVLDISVEEVRRVLECDRVVVYSLNQDKYGVVIAESVSAGYPRALNKTIEEPYFEARYLDKYRDGEIRAINDIYEAGMTKCYIEHLENLEVKANLVTPILNEGKLFGLLVAHQCREPRNWQDYEIRWVTQIATQVGFALDNAKVLAASAIAQIQVEKERKWTNYFTDATKYIRASIKQEDVLDTSVEEVRRVLECDRVVVYSLNQDKYGVVIAESVSAGYPRALNKTIKDPCFEAKYLDKYRDGRVRAINNIYEAGMSKCYIEQLENLEVKANLVTPILNEGKLFGLLVAHQCSEPRNWQDYEIRWMTQIATQVGFALDNATLLKKLKNDGLPMQLLNNFSFGISEKVNRSQLLKIAVEQARKVIKLDRVILYQFDDNLNGNIVAESVVPGYPKALNSQSQDPCFAKEYGEKYRQGRTEAIANIHQANLTAYHLEQLESLSVKASVIVPIVQDEQLFGLLIGHQCQQPRLWSQSEIDLFAQLALQLGLALDRVGLREALNAAKNVQRNETDKQHLEQQSLNQKISKLLTKNQAALQDLGAKISHHSATQGKVSKSKNTQIENDVNAAKKVEILNQSHQYFYQMVNPINDMKEKSDLLSASNQPALPMGEITIEAREVTLETMDSYDYDLDVITGQLTKDSESAPSLLLTNQFIGDITDLSDKISQQSLIVTDSFRKLAEFAQQLSEPKEL
ncbi:GAF domain-containing protein [Pleurocapsa sp. FMAR1]|uniref:GAF domain-containing protein n=1 Tax=Pleurocapsa sp. FMAR1 TaxID=3040204 RepID=UPI0029C998DD|nr:GAF domain-containing protein [Pleurocapsa sp. FMAR1]